MSIENAIFAASTLAAAALAVAVCIRAVTPVEIYDPALQQELLAQKESLTCKASSSVSRSAFVCSVFFGQQPFHQVDELR
jgi:hypothetical protein